MNERNCLCRLTDQNNNEPDVKKMKLGSLDDVNSIIEEKMKIQNRHFYNLRTNLEKSLTTAELTEILQANEQFIPTSPSDVIFLTFVTPQIIYYFII